MRVCARLPACHVSRRCFFKHPMPFASEQQTLTWSNSSNPTETKRRAGPQYTLEFALLVREE